MVGDFKHAVGAVLVGDFPSLAEAEWALHEIKWAVLTIVDVFGGSLSVCGSIGND